MQANLFVSAGRSLIDPHVACLVRQERGWLNREARNLAGEPRQLDLVSQTE